MNKSLSTNLVIYGAGVAAPFELKKVTGLGLSPVCFCDRDINKQGMILSGLPVLSIPQARARFGEFNVWVPPMLQLKHNVIEYLISIENVREEQIFNLSDYDLYKGCPVLESEITVYDDRMAFCCSLDIMEWGEIPQIYWVDYCNDVESGAAAYTSIRNELADTIKRGAPSGCDKCAQIKTAYFPKEKQVYILTFSLEAVPCQLSCSYCCSLNSMQEKVFDYKLLVRSLEKQDLLSTDTMVGLASGEISIDPQKDELLAAVEEYRLSILTNAVIFDGDILKLAARPGSGMNVSVDSGTAETYKKIKGLDVFEIVWGNISRYRGNGADISLKYIFLPENSNENDVYGFIKHVQAAKITKIQISADAHKKENHSGEQIRLMAEMCLLAEKNDISWSLLETINTDDRIKVQNEISSKRGRI